jgi:hypothetical protein
MSLRLTARVSRTARAVIWSASVASFAAGLLSAASSAHADATWINGADNLWSNPNNWSPVGVPAPGTNLVIGGTGGTIVQDIADPFPVGNIQFIGPKTEIAGGALMLANGATISNNFAPHRIRAGVNIPTSAILHGVGGIETSVAFDDLRGTGNVTVDGRVLIIGATYSGTTTINTNAGLWIGGRQGVEDVEPGLTTGQGDYVVNGGLHGTGTIGLAAGAAVRVNSGGLIDPSIGFTLGAHDISQFTIDGDLIIGAGSYVAADANVGSNSQIFNDRIDVLGTLDLSAPSDNLFIGNTMVFNFVPAQQIVVMTYESRIGEFDLLNNGTNPNYGIIYTSAPGAGPGQVIIVTPEPSAAACVFVCVAALTSRRRARIRSMAHAC